MVTEKEREITEGVETAEDETDVLRRENETLTRELKSRDTALSRLEQSMVAKDEEIASLKQSLDEANRKLDKLNESLAEAVAAYRELIIQSNPGLLAELIVGETIDEVNESLKNARVLMERVRQEMEAEASKTRIPAGAPQRTILDLSALSPREKIQYAIGGSSS